MEHWMGVMWKLGSVSSCGEGTRSSFNPTGVCRLVPRQLFSFYIFLCVSYRIVKRYILHIRVKWRLLSSRACKFRLDTLTGKGRKDLVYSLPFFLNILCQNTRWSNYCVFGKILCFDKIFYGKILRFGKKIFGHKILCKIFFDLLFLINIFFGRRRIFWSKYFNNFSFLFFSGLNSLHDKLGWGERACGRSGSFVVCFIRSPQPSRFLIKSKLY